MEDRCALAGPWPLLFPFFQPGQGVYNKHIVPCGVLLLIFKNEITVVQILSSIYFDCVIMLINLKSQQKTSDL